MASLTRMIETMVQPLKRRVLLMIGRGVVQLVNDAKGLQVVQITGLAGEVLDGVERFQEYGFSSMPDAGAEAVFVAVSGDRSHPIILGTEDRRFRLKNLGGGDVAIYSKGNNYAILRASGDIEVYADRDLTMLAQGDMRIEAGGILRIEAEGLELHGRTFVQNDVHGKGQRETWVGGTDYQTDSYTIGATGSSSEHGLDQPDIPSDHPGGA